MKRVKNYYNKYKNKNYIYIHYKDINNTNITRRIINIDNEIYRHQEVKRIKKEGLKMHLYLKEGIYTL